MIVRIGTRNSKLALAQTEIVIKSFQDVAPHIECVVVPIVTTGDLITNKNLYDIGGKALFLKELEEALYNNKIDIAVHSLKDVPGNLDTHFIIAAMLERDEAYDVLVSNKYRSIDELPKNANVGTSSMRRKILLQHIRKDLNIINCRGNIDSRIKKLNSQEFDAIILAYAGIKRLGIQAQEDFYITPLTQIIPAVGQGVIALEIKIDNNEMHKLCAMLNHLPTWKILQAERSFIEYLCADCQTPIAAFAEYTNHENIIVNFMLSDVVGKKIVFHNAQGNIDSARDIGIKAAKILQERLLSKI